MIQIKMHNPVHLRYSAKLVQYRRCLFAWWRYNNGSHDSRDASRFGCCDIRTDQASKCWWNTPIAMLSMTFSDWSLNHLPPHLPGNYDPKDPCQQADRWQSATRVELERQGKRTRTYREQAWIPSFMLMHCRWCRTKECAVLAGLTIKNVTGARAHIFLYGSNSRELYMRQKGRHEYV
jgi:hypothetical protein